MLTRISRLYAPQLVVLTLLLAGVLGAQNAEPKENQTTPVPEAEYSGMYSFLRDGEFVQITIDAPGHVIGFISRYGDSDSDHDVFLDQFFKSAKLDSNKLTFTTETVQGKSFEFSGVIERGVGKNHNEEAYYVLKGTLTEDTIDAAKKTSSQSHEVALRSFPQDMAPPQNGRL
jgi:hypothetical protein